MSDICQIEGCGTWIGRPRQKVCDECKRKLKRVPLVKCEWSDCTTQFPKGGNRKFCVDHTAMYPKRCVHGTNPPEACEHCSRQEQTRKTVLVEQAAKTV